MKPTPGKAKRSRPVTRECYDVTVKQLQDAYSVALVAMEAHLMAAQELIDTYYEVVIGDVERESIPPEKWGAVKLTEQQEVAFIRLIPANAKARRDVFSILYAANPNKYNGKNKK